MMKKNRIMILDIMSIPLTRGLYALVDGKNYEWLNKWKWFAKKGRNTYYAVRNIGKSPKQKTVWMHREILNIPQGMETDHRNHCGLDNRELNIRICTHSENHQNQVSTCGASKYKGVCWHKQDKKWQASIRHNYQSIHLGLFDSEIEAAKTYDKVAKEFFGKFANLNFS